MRRTIEEIATLFELEPITRRDVFVEGSDDKDLISWFFQQAGTLSRGIYTANDIDIPVELIDGFGLNRGSNRDRIICLSAALRGEIHREICSLSFIVDFDLAACCPKQMAPNGVLMTDFPSCDCYLLNDELVDRFIETHCRIFDGDAKRMRGAVHKVCRFLYALRVVLELTSIRARLVGVDKALRMVAGVVDLNGEAVLRKTLSAASRLADLELIELATEEMLSRMEAAPANPLRYVHGHDALKVLGECVHLRMADSAYRDERRVRRALLMGLKLHMVSKFALFIQLAA